LDERRVRAGRPTKTLAKTIFEEKTAAKIFEKIFNDDDGVRAADF